MAVVSIPLRLEDAILAQRLEGHGVRGIAAWLSAEHGVDVSPRTVARFLEGHRRESASTHKATINAVAASGALDDLGRLDVHARKLHELALEQAERGELREYRLTVEQLRKVAHTRLQFSGADTPDAAISDLADAAQRVSSRLARIAASRGASGPDGAAGPDDRRTGGA